MSAGPVQTAQLIAQALGHYGIDVDGSVCAFQSDNCTAHMIGAGGLDEHHEYPLSLGGQPDGKLLLLCPNHHRRQHSLVRYLVENEAPQWAVLRHFTEAERETAANAVAMWKQDGSPPVAGWPAPAARDA